MTRCPKCGSDDLKTVKTRDPFRKRTKVVTSCYSCWTVLTTSYEDDKPKDKDCSCPNHLGRPLPLV